MEVAVRAPAWRQLVEARRAALGAEVLPEPVIGWRAWRLQPLPDGYVLRSLAQDEGPWPRRSAFQAHCLRRIDHGPSPGAACVCGIYAWKEAAQLAGAAKARPSVVGTVALWGRVVEHAGGYRAEQAYPQRLRLACPRCLVERGETAVAGLFHATGWRSLLATGELVALCRHHAGPLADRLEDPRPVERALLDAYAVDPLPAEAVPPAP
ncbi:MAG TPA: hypothetical protein VNO17_07715, partial [Actinomycetota bacterium]|nr:hypothetical protein [Actinomycetota bacterium]